MMRAVSKEKVIRTASGASSKVATDSVSECAAARARAAARRSMDDAGSKRRNITSPAARSAAGSSTAGAAPEAGGGEMVRSIGTLGRVALLLALSGCNAPPPEQNGNGFFVPDQGRIVSLTRAEKGRG